MTLFELAFASLTVATAIGIGVYMYKMINTDYLSHKHSH